MTKGEILQLVEQESSRNDPFQNYHGITSSNIRSFLVDPYLVTVDPDDLETGPREMWVILKAPNPGSGYVVVYDPQDQF